MSSAIPKVWEGNAFLRHMLPQSECLGPSICTCWNPNTQCAGGGASVRAQGWGPVDGISALVEQSHRAPNPSLPCIQGHRGVSGLEKGPRWPWGTLIWDFPSKPWAIISSLTTHLVCGVCYSHLRALRHLLNPRISGWMKSAFPSPQDTKVSLFTGFFKLSTHTKYFIILDLSDLGEFGNSYRTSKWPIPWLHSVFPCPIIIKPWLCCLYSAE